MSLKVSFEELGSQKLPCVSSPVTQVCVIPEAWLFCAIFLLVLIRVVEDSNTSQLIINGCHRWCLIHGCHLNEDNKPDWRRPGGCGEKQNDLMSEHQLWHYVHLGLNPGSRPILGWLTLGKSIVTLSFSFLICKMKYSNVHHRELLNYELASCIPNTSIGLGTQKCSVQMRYY